MKIDSNVLTITVTVICYLVVIYQYHDNIQPGHARQLQDDIVRGSNLSKPTLPTIRHSTRSHRTVGIVGFFPPLYNHTSYQPVIQAKLAPTHVRL